MAAESAPRTPFEQLILLNRDVFTSGHHYTAYHILVAALHEARAQEDLAGLGAVQQIAEAQASLLDQMAQQGDVPTPAAEARGHVRLFAVLAHQAQAQRQLLETQRKQHGRFLAP
jgi:hypothetical protein